MKENSKSNYNLFNKIIFTATVASSLALSGPFVHNGMMNYHAQKEIKKIEEKYEGKDKLYTELEDAEFFLNASKNFQSVYDNLPRYFIKRTPEEIQKTKSELERVILKREAWVRNVKEDVQKYEENLDKSAKYRSNTAYSFAGLIGVLGLGGVARIINEKNKKRKSTENNQTN